MELNKASWHFETKEGGVSAIVLDTPIPFEFGGKQYVVPAGTLSDGMSVPRALWGILSPCYDPVTLAPSVVHDYLYAHSEICTREEADTWYRDELLKAGFPPWKAKIVFWGVRAFGKSHHV